MSKSGNHRPFNITARLKIWLWSMLPEVLPFLHRNQHVDFWQGESLETDNAMRRKLRHPPKRERDLLQSTHITSKYLKQAVGGVFETVPHLAV